MSYPGLTPLQRCSQCILQRQPTGQSDGEASVPVLKGILNTPSLLLLLVPPQRKVVVPVRFPSMDQMELFNNLTEGKEMFDIESNY